MSQAHKDEMRELASQHLSKYREMSYAELRQLVEREHVDTFEARGSANSRYQVEVTFHWDDAKDGDIRVDAMIDQDPHRPLFGFLPVYISSIGDGFIMQPDGSFIDE